MKVGTRFIRYSRNTLDAIVKGHNNTRLIPYPTARGFTFRSEQDIERFLRRRLHPAALVMTLSRKSCKRKGTREAVAFLYDTCKSVGLLGSGMCSIRMTAIDAKTGIKTSATIHLTSKSDARLLFRAVTSKGQIGRAFSPVSAEYPEEWTSPFPQRDSKAYGGDVKSSKDNTCVDLKMEVWLYAN